MKIFTIINNRKKILGQNKRNIFYIRKYNKDQSKFIADNKLMTKEVLTKEHISTPLLLGVIKDYQDLQSFDWDKLPKSFVLKPVNGLEGGGIDIFYNRNKNGNWIRSDKSQASIKDLKSQIVDILNGKYSLNYEPDQVMFEERVQNHKIFKYYTYKGTPDIRVIIFNNIPVMSMIRLPTKESQGKANLALGAIGAGIDIAKGVTTNAIHGKKGKIEYIPGTSLRVSGLKIPYWDKILEYSIKAQKASNLRFAAVDFLIDREQGPMIVELNARPGLSIQLANGDGLNWRLRKAQGVKVSSTSKGIRLGKDLFGGEIEEEIENITGKDVIGLYEKVKLFDHNNNQIDVKAKIDTGADSTSIDTAIAIKLGFASIIDTLASEKIPDNLTREEGKILMNKLANKYEGKLPGLEGINLIHSSHGSSIRPLIRIAIQIQDTKFSTKATIFDRSQLKFPIIIGRKSIGSFLVDPSKTH